MGNAKFIVLGIVLAVLGVVLVTTLVISALALAEIQKDINVCHLPPNNEVNGTYICEGITTRKPVVGDTCRIDCNSFHRRNRETATCEEDGKLGQDLFCAPMFVAVISPQMNWTTASEYCESQFGAGAHLAEINTDVEFEGFYDYMRPDLIYAPDGPNAWWMGATNQVTDDGETFLSWYTSGTNISLDVLCPRYSSFCGHVDETLDASVATCLYYNGDYYYEPQSEFHHDDCTDEYSFICEYPDP